MTKNDTKELPNFIDANDTKELPNFIDTNDIIKLTDFLDKYRVNYKIVENNNTDYRREA